MSAYEIYYLSIVGGGAAIITGFLIYLLVSHSIKNIGSLKDEWQSRRDEH